MTKKERIAKYKSELNEHGIHPSNPLANLIKTDENGKPSISLTSFLKTAKDSVVLGVKELYESCNKSEFKGENNE